MTKQEMSAFRKRKKKILRLAEQGVTQSEIARRLGMTRQRIYQIVRGK